MKDFFRNMAELRIREAIAESKFAYTVLKNSGDINLADKPYKTE